VDLRRPADPGLPLPPAGVELTFCLTEMKHAPSKANPNLLLY
jgi:hypothetical protein